MVHQSQFNNASNSTNNTLDAFGHSLSQAFAVAIATYFVVLTAAAVLFNGFLIATIANTRSLHSSTNLFIVNLALCDMLVGLGILPLDADFLLKGRFTYGVFVCGLKETVFMFSLPASIVNLFLLTMERFVLIVFPYKHCRVFTKRRIIGILIFIWVYIIGVALFPIIRYKNGILLKGGKCGLYLEGPYVLYQVVVNFICPLVCIIIMNFVIYRVASKHCREIKKNHSAFNIGASRSMSSSSNNNRNNKNNSSSNDNKNNSNNDSSNIENNNRYNSNMNNIKTTTISINATTTSNSSNNNNRSNNNISINNNNNNRNNSNNNSKNNNSKRRKTMLSQMMPSNFKAAKNIMVLVGVFLACWLTFIVLVMWNVLCGICHPREVTWTGNAINYSSIVLNPLLYGLLNKKVRRVVWKRCFAGCSAYRSNHREERVRLETSDTQCMLTVRD